jgi:methylenetetrahydrofolate reductase (NADPH)
MRTSIEIVPRDRTTLREEVGALTRQFPGIDTVNLPDVARAELSSCEAAGLIARIIPHRIVHLRSRGTSNKDLPALIQRLRQANVTETIVIAGDPRADDNGGLMPTELIRALHKEGFRAYAALDPYHYAKADNLRRNVDEKLAAGAAGFFTQPLFTLSMLDRCANLLPSTTVFWGLSPITTQHSQAYWERINNVHFPADFEPTLAWSQRFALRCLSEIAARGDNAYLMPIKVDVAEYLAPIFPATSETSA